MKNTILKFTLFTVLIITLIVGCKKEWDTPPISSIPETSKITIAQLKSYYSDTTGSHRFTEELSVYATVTMDETSGNLYKNVFVQDSTGAIQMRLLSSGGLYEGDYVRIYLPGTTISTYQGMYQLDSVNTDKNVVKQETKQNKTPFSVTIDQINDDIKLYEGYLIQLNDVEFELCGGSDTYADKVNQLSVDRALLDCNGNNIIARTSGYANFAGDDLPYGKGSLVAIVGNYRGTPQLIIRSVEEVQLGGLRCSGGTGDCSAPQASFAQTFDNVVEGGDVCQECWSNIAVKGSRFWEGTYDDFAWSGTNVIEASGYNSTEPELEIWFISPPVVFEATNKLTFESAKAYTWQHNGITAWVSSNFDGSNVSSATWIELSQANIAGNNNSVVYSGDLYMVDYLGQNYSGNYHVGFRYKANPLSNQTTTYRIDNIRITK